MAHLPGAPSLGATDQPERGHCMALDTVTPKGEALRRALRWLSDQGRHDAAAIEEAARRFDLSPMDEEFLLRHCREAASQGMDIHPLSEDADSGVAGEE